MEKESNNIFDSEFSPQYILKLAKASLRKLKQENMVLGIFLGEMVSGIGTKKSVPCIEVFAVDGANQQMIQTQLEDLPLPLKFSKLEDDWRPDMCFIDFLLEEFFCAKEQAGLEYELLDDIKCGTAIGRQIYAKCLEISIHITDNGEPTYVRGIYLARELAYGGSKHSI